MKHAAQFGDIFKRFRKNTFFHTIRIQTEGLKEHHHHFFRGFSTSGKSLFVTLIKKLKRIDLEEFEFNSTGMSKMITLF